MERIALCVSSCVVQNYTDKGDRVKTYPVPGCKDEFQAKMFETSIYNREVDSGKVCPVCKHSVAEGYSILRMEACIGCLEEDCENCAFYQTLRDVIGVELTTSQYVGCAHCGERRIDKLIWVDDEKVRCESCGKVDYPG